MVTAVLLSVAALTATAGWATGWSAIASGTASVGTGSWGVVATTATGTPAPGPLILTYVVPIIGGPAPQPFTLVNTGSSTLTGAAYAVGVSGGGLLSSTTITLTACVGATWSASSTCAGTKQVLGTWSASSSAPVTSSVVPTAPGGRLSVQASVGGSGIVGGLIKAVISVRVAAGQPRELPPSTARLV